MQRLGLLGAILLCAALGVVVGGGAASVPPGTLVMSGLDNPRGVAFDKHGNLYVAEAGRGGASPCAVFSDGLSRCYGPTGRVSRLRHGVQQVVASGLPSNGFVVGATVLAPPAWAPLQQAAGPLVRLPMCPGSCLTERTPNGYRLRVLWPPGPPVRSGSAPAASFARAKTGRLWVSCPDGRALGVSAPFYVRHGHFSIGHKKGQKTAFSFSGYRDQPRHFDGHGTVRAGACGKGVPTSFAEPAQGTVRWVSCPPDDPANPYPSNTPFTFAGQIPWAAAGTRLRIEYTDPTLPSAFVTVHVQTDQSGNFTDTHAFPAQTGGFAYGASAQARYPDQPLNTDTAVCSFLVR